MLVFDMNGKGCMDSKTKFKVTGDDQGTGRPANELLPHSKLKKKFLICIQVNTG